MAVFQVSLGQWSVGSGLVVMPKDNKYRRTMREYVSPSPPPPHPPPPLRGKDAKAKVRSTSGSTASDQVIEFSFLDRAGLVTIATEQAAKVSCPDTPIPKQSLLVAGVRDFTPARPVIVDTHVIAGPST